MATAPVARYDRRGRFAQWFLQDETERAEGPHAHEGAHAQKPWSAVMCLTGVDYFSTLGYQPGIAALAAGALSPVATLILVIVTLAGALPVYRRVAAESPNGQGSIAMLERLLPWWPGKLFVLVLLGFAATDFVITITLSAADATAHLIENPYTPPLLHGQRVVITLVLVALLGAVFLKGFGEAIGIAVGLVAIYLTLNLVVVIVTLAQVIHHPMVVTNWRHALVTAHASPLAMVGVSLLLFPKLALGLSGFETGVAVMPLVRGGDGDDPAKPAGRIRNTRKLLLTASLVMSAFLITTSFVTITLIPADAFRPGGAANGRALAYLAHQYLGSGFGTAYDVSTICILWFAGASAMAGLLNLVPRYLPRYGMAPEWARAVRPLVLVFAAVSFAITLLFHADVDKQGGAYATGVLVLITSAAVAVTLSVRRTGSRPLLVVFAVIALIFAYTTVVNVYERPDGVKIGAFFIGAIVLTSIVSRLRRTTELRVSGVTLDPVAQHFIEEIAARTGTVHLIAHDPFTSKTEEYGRKLAEQRAEYRIPEVDTPLFLEIAVRDASEFAPELTVTGAEVDGYRVLRGESAAVPNAIAALLLHLRDEMGSVPHAYFDWSERSPFGLLVRYVLFGEGDTAPVTHEVLRKAEPDAARRPAIHVS